VQVTGPQPFVHPDTGAWGRLGSYAIVSARVEVTPVEGVQLWLRGDNLADMAYETDYGFPEPGASVWLGMRIHTPQDPVRP
jgi:outer membrane cobalamin receptor